MQEHMDSGFLAGRAQRFGEELPCLVAPKMSSHGTWPPSSPVIDYHNLTPVAHARGQQPAHDAHQYGSEDGSPKTVDLKTFHE